MPGRFLITGSCGQIGTELTEALIRRYGGKSIVATDIVKPGRSDCTTAALDVTDGQEVSRIVKAEGIGTVVHLAAILSAKGEKMPDLAFDVNVNGMRNLLKAAVNSIGTRVFFPSTIGIFGPDTPKEDVPIDTITRPTTMYGITKLLCEQLGDYYFLRYGLDVRGLRLPGIVSHRTPPGGGTTDYAIEMLRAAAEGNDYTCFLREDSSLPMMYMPDALEAIIKLIEAPSSALRHRTNFNVMAFSLSPSGLEHEIRKLIPAFRVTYSPDERQAIADSWPRSLDSSVAAREWGFYPRYTLPEMVKDMLKSLAPITKKE